MDAEGANIKQIYVKRSGKRTGEKSDFHSYSVGVLDGNKCCMRHLAC
ncbi:hypothetical protein HD_0460 [[Haemophilus] ducreyi 35000HP]|uniref:Uncharacterized protein n=1 Tax=Haemophilus ducreyi (strain 35000HP / ATCC 700724) TaxID=233412 RepID=Q7VNN1_HAEDU|nr:hypothetical protein HD_0460 [[Haemophilus] ducreyi 35000HP]